MDDPIEERLKYMEDNGIWRLITDSDRVGHIEVW